MSGAPYKIQMERNPPALVAHLLKERRDRLEERAKTAGWVSQGSVGLSNGTYPGWLKVEQILIKDHP